MSIKEAFRRVEPGEEPPAAPEWLQTWSSQTTYGVFGGMLFGGYRGLIMSRNEQLSTPPGAAAKAQHRAAAFFVRESILTGSRIGLFVSFFSGLALSIQSYSPYSRTTNYAATGALTCGIFAGGAAGLKVIIPAAGFGGATAATAAAVQELLTQAVNNFEDSEQSDQKMTDACEQLGSVALVIKRYEDKLDEHPLRLDSNGNGFVASDQIKD